MNLIDRLRVGWKKAKNERLYRRIPTNIPVRIYPHNSTTPAQEMIGNWSPGGVFIATKNLLPIEALVMLEFSLGEKESSILKLQGQVVRHQKNSVGDVEGFGVMFTDFTQSGLFILRELLTQSYPAAQT